MEPKTEPPQSGAGVILASKLPTASRNSFFTLRLPKAQLRGFRGDARRLASCSQLPRTPPRTGVHVRVISADGQRAEAGITTKGVNAIVTVPGGPGSGRVNGVMVEIGRSSRERRAALEFIVVMDANIAAGSTRERERHGSERSSRRRNHSAYLALRVILGSTGSGSEPELMLPADPLRGGMEDKK